MLGGHILDQQLGHQALGLSDNHLDILGSNTEVFARGVPEDNSLVGFRDQQAGVNTALYTLTREHVPAPLRLVSEIPLNVWISRSTLLPPAYSQQSASSQWWFLLAFGVM